jgi:DNA-binding NtrC family response regulator
MDILTGFKNVRMLLIAEDAWIRNSMKLYFTSAGCKIDVVETARAARTIMKTAFFEVIFIDNDLPDIVYQEVLSEFESNFPAGYKILLTPFKSQKLELATKEAGFISVIEKPLNAAAIESVLGLILEDDANYLTGSKCSKVHSCQY